MYVKIYVRLINNNFKTVAFLSLLLSITLFGYPTIDQKKKKNKKIDNHVLYHLKLQCLNAMGACTSLPARKDMVEGGSSYNKVPFLT